MAQAIRHHLALRRSGGDSPRGRQEIVASYEYRVLSRQLADVFDRVAG
jgi:hypothetical protein